MTLIKTYIYKDLSSISAVNAVDNRTRVRFYSFIKKKSGEKGLGHKNRDFVDSRETGLLGTFLGLFHPTIHQFLTD